jgi:uncharacterized protein YbjT (DUF2867 family)
VSGAADPVLLTGATGIVGHAIARALIRRRRRVRALVRSVERARKLMPPACELVPGDVTDAPSVERAIVGCRTVYHAAGLPSRAPIRAATAPAASSVGRRRRFATRSPRRSRSSASSRKR